jgi:hypothetical protein
MAKKNWSPEDREKVIALIRDVKQDVQELLQYVQGLRDSKR